MTQLPPTSKQAILDKSIPHLAQYPGASMQELAKAIGIGRATLYRHFENRDALLQAIAINALEETTAAVNAALDRSQPAMAQLHTAITAMIPFADKFSFLTTHSSSLSDTRSEQLYAAQLNFVSDLINQAKQQGDIAADVPTAWVVASIDMLIYAAWQTVEQGDVARNEAANLVMRTLTSGLTHVT